MKTRMEIESLAGAMLVFAAVMVMCLMTGCLNLGGGRQVVSLPWSAPEMAFDSVATQQKHGKAAGMVLGGTSEVPTPGSPVDQQITVGENQSNARSTDAAVGTGQGQGTIGREVGGDVSPTQTPDLAVTPGSVADPAAITDAQAMALLKRLQEAQAKLDAAKATTPAP